MARPAAAQQRHGTLEGETLDQDGQVLPGVAVTLTGSNMMGARTAISDLHGAFRIVPVPPGRYTVTASLSGFQTVVQEALPVGLDTSVRVKIAMERGFEEVVEVYADQVLIDPTSSRVGANITDDFLERLPTDRQYQTVMSMLPGVVDDNNPLVHGSSGYDNVYLVDGADTSDPMTRTWATAINFDDIQEVQVTTGGISAEHGKGTGALVNLVTKSGSNELHGLARFTYSDIDLNSPARGDRYYFSDSTRYLSEQRWGANLGGPIVRDHLWFFVSYEARDKSKPISYWAGPEDLLNAAGGTVGEINQNISKGETGYTGHYFTGKLSWSPSPSHQVMASYLEDPIDIPRLYGYQGYQSRNAESDQRRQQGGSNGVLNWTGILTDNILLDFRYNLKRDELNNLPVGEGTTYMLSNAAGTVYWGNAPWEYRTNRDHDIFALTYTQFVDELAGSHQLKLGIEHATIGIDHYEEENPGDEHIRYRSNGSEWYLVTYLQRRGWRSTRTTTNTLFIQDSWSVSPALTLDLGLRLETLVEQTPQGFRGLDHGPGDRIAPRLGFAWSIGESILRGSWGRYYDTIGNEVTRTFVEAPDLIRDVYLWNSGQEDWVYYRRDTIGPAHTTLEDLKAPYMDELTLGFEGRITDTLAWSATGIYREWRNGIEDDDGQVFPDYPDNPPADGNFHFTNIGRYREYKGLELTLRKMLGRDRLQLLASYTWSETLSLWGNTDYFSGHADNPFRYHNYWGRPFYAPTHMLKLNGSYFLPLGFVLGGNLSWWSDLPYTITAEVDTSEASPWGDRNFTGYFLEERGSRTLDPLWTMDLRVEKSFKLSGGLTLSGYVDIFNVFDNQDVVSVDSRYGVVEIDEPGQTIDNNGVPIDTSSFEPTPDQWQAPRSYFFGVKLEF